MMLKSELIARLAKKHPHISIRTVHNSVNHLIDVLRTSLIEQHRIEIRGFGSFSIKHKKERIAHNPKTGQKIVMQEKCIPHFKPGKPLRERINESRLKCEISE